MSSAPSSANTWSRQCFKGIHWEHSQRLRYPPQATPCKRSLLAVRARDRPPARGGPRGVNRSPCERQAGHPQGVALLYTRAWGHVVYSRATPCGWPAATGSVRFWGHPLRVACGDRKCTLPGPPLAAALRRPSGNASGATPGGWPGSGLHLESLWMLPVRKRIMYGRRDRGQ